MEKNITKLDDFIPGKIYYSEFNKKNISVFRYINSNYSNVNIFLNYDIEINRFTKSCLKNFFWTFDTKFFYREATEEEIIHLKYCEQHGEYRELEEMYVKQFIEEYLTE